MHVHTYITMGEVTGLITRFSTLLSSAILPTYSVPTIWDWTSFDVWLHTHTYHPPSSFWSEQKKSIRAKKLSCPFVRWWCWREMWRKGKSFRINKAFPLFCRSQGIDLVRDPPSTANLQIEQRLGGVGSGRSPSSESIPTPAQHSQHDSICTMLSVSSGGPLLGQPQSRRTSKPVFLITNSEPIFITCRMYNNR